ncbi:MAG: hypothetical protein ACYSUV_21615 [Planctomycetota bacterium]|jgi:hypothetical protein
MLFFARFPDRGIYCAGPQTSAAGETIPGGPIGYERYEEAKLMADALGGDVVERGDDYCLEWCKSKRLTLWIKKAGGGMGYIEETVVEDPPSLIRVEGPEREAALRASAQINRVN